VAGAWALHPTRTGAPQYLSAPPIGLAACGPLRRAISPALLRVASRLAGRTLRLDLHPLDLASASHMLALEDVIRARSRAARASPTTILPRRPESSLTGAIARAIPPSTFAPSYPHA